MLSWKRIISSKGKSEQMSQSIKKMFLLQGKGCLRVVGQDSVLELEQETAAVVLNRFLEINHFFEVEVDQHVVHERGKQPLVVVAYDEYSLHLLYL